MKSTNRRRVAGLVLLVAAAAAPAGIGRGAERALTLREAVDMALERNEELQIQRESLGAARAQVREARGAYDPVLELEGAWWRSTEPWNTAFSGGAPEPLGPRVESTEAGLGIRQLMPTGGVLSLGANASRETTEEGTALLSPAYRTRVGIQWRQPLLRRRGTDAARLSLRTAKAGRRGAAAEVRRATAETVAAVEQAYWTLTHARLAIQVHEEAIRLAEEQLEDTQDRVESGTSPRTELAQPRAELERRRGDLFAARQELARSENALKLLMLDGEDDPLWALRLAPVDEIEADVVAMDAASSLEQALLERPELEMVEAVVERRRAEAAFARDGIWPSLDAVLSYDRFGLAGSGNAAGSSTPIPPELDGKYGRSFESLRDGDFDAARVALVLGLPIGNRTARGRAAAARHLERQAESDVQRLRKAIQAEVLDAAAALETAGQRIEAARSGRQAAETQLSAERDRFESGLSTNFLVLTRQNDLSRARLDEISALTDYRAARTEWARATGSLLEERGIDVGADAPEGGMR